MVMIRDFSQSRNSSCARLSSSRPPASSSEVNALMSAPAQNSAGFGEAMIIAFTPPPSIDRQAFSSASITCGASELAGGLSSHRIAISPRVSSLTGALS